MASHFCDRYVLYCPDYRGRGQSDYDANADNYAPSTYLNDLRHLLVLNGLHRVVVIGTSLGGLLGMAMSVAMPTAVSGLVMNDIGPNVEGLSSIVDYVRVDRPQTNWADAVAELRLRFPDLSLQNECDWIDAAKATWRKGADGLLHFDWDVALIKPILRQSPVDLWPLFSALRRLPVMAIRGEKSKIISQVTFDKMARAHPNLQQVTVANVGHAPSLREAVCVDALGSFLDRTSSG